MQNQKIGSGKSLLLHTFSAIIIAFLLLINVNAQETPVEQRDALMAIYNSTNGDNWTNNSNWGVGDPYQNKWYGLEFWPDGQVMFLFLGSNNLTGNIPPDIAALKALIRLSLGYNNLDTLPPEIGEMSQLSELNLIHVGLTEIPFDPSGLTHLRRLYLDENQLTSLPPEIGQLRQLEYLNLNRNNLVVLPNEIGELTNLQSLNLRENKLNTIPSTIEKLQNLRGIDLYRNEVTVLPPELEHLPSLVGINLNYNKLESIPPFIFRMTNFKSLLFANNNIQGEIPSEIGNLVNVTYIQLENNQLSGDIPDGFGNLVNLGTLYMQNNQFTSLPSTFGNLVALESCHVNNNLLQGKLPKNIGNLSKLKYLFAQNNELSDSLPQGLSNLGKLMNLNLSSNNFIGQIPPEFGNLTNLVYLNLANNNLDGNLPPELGYLSKLFELNLSSNNLTGSIPKEFGLFPLRIKIYLHYNQLSGCFHPDLNALCENGSVIGTYGNLDLTNFTYFCRSGTNECVICSINNISVGTQTPCQSSSNTYTQELEVSFVDPPKDGYLVVNDQNYTFETNPKKITLNGLVADGQPVDVYSYFNTITECSFYGEALFTAPPACHTPIAVCSPVTVSADNSCTAMASIDAGSNDPDEGDVLTITQDPPGPYSLGETLVTLTVSDGSSSASCSSVVTVVDNSAPVADINPLPDIFGECSVTVENTPTALDNCSGVIAGTTQAPLFYSEQGEYFIDWSFEDDYGNILTQQQKVIVDDITPPVLIPKAPPVEVFDKSIHQEVTYTMDQLIESVSDNCTFLTYNDITIIRVESDEDEDGDMPEVNDGNTSDDIVIEDGCQSVTLMAECDLNSNGRVYTIYFEVDDYHGNTTIASTEVHVIHKDIESAVNNGPFYIITNCGKPDKLKSTQEIEIINELSITNYPNPFNGKTTIEFVIPEKGNVNIVLYDNVGREVSNILNKEKSAGRHTTEFDGTGFGPGIYFYKLMYKNTSVTSKMVLQN